MHANAVFLSAGDSYSQEVAARVRCGVVVTSLRDVERCLVSMSRIEAVDLVGHTATPDRLLRLGVDLLDARSPRITRAFSDVGHQLRRAGVRHLRLLGCGSAVTPAGRLTLRELARLLDPIAVYGTSDFVAARHFDSRGLKTRYSRTLVAATDLR